MMIMALREGHETVICGRSRERRWAIRPTWQVFPRRAKGSDLNSPAGSNVQPGPDRRLSANLPGTCTPIPGAIYHRHEGHPPPRSRMGRTPRRLRCVWRPSQRSGSTPVAGCTSAWRVSAVSPATVRHDRRCRPEGMRPRHSGHAAVTRRGDRTRSVIPRAAGAATDPPAPLGYALRDRTRSDIPVDLRGRRARSCRGPQRVPISERTSSVGGPGHLSYLRAL